MKHTSQGEINQRENRILCCDLHEQVPHARNAHSTQRLFRKNVDILQQLCQKPMQRVVEADPALQDVKIHDSVFNVPEENVVVCWLCELVLVELVVR